MYHRRVLGALVYKMAQNIGWPISQRDGSQRTMQGVSWGSIITGIVNNLCPPAYQNKTYPKTHADRFGGKVTCKEGMFNGRRLRLMVSQASQLGPFPEVLHTKPKNFAPHYMIEGMHCTVPRVGILGIEKAPPWADDTAPPARSIAN